MILTPYLVQGDVRCKYEVYLLAESDEMAERIGVELIPAEDNDFVLVTNLRTVSDAARSIMGDNLMMYTQRGYFNTRTFNSDIPFHVIKTSPFTPYTTREEKIAKLLDA